jgi:type I restriction enzyme S subunit
MRKEDNTPALRFPEFKDEWGKKRLGQISKWSSGGTPSKDNPLYWNGDIPWISASTMRGIEYSDSVHKITLEGLKNGSRLVPKGNLLILVRGSMLFNTIPIGITARDVAFNQDVKSIVVDEKNSTKFVLYWFFSAENMILNMVTGTGIGAGKLDLSDLRNLPLQIPALAEQQKIASFLASVDEKLMQIKQQKALLEQYKKGVMQRIFSQEIRFRDENGKEFPEWKPKTLSQLAKILYGKDQKKVVAENGIFPILGTGGIIGNTNQFLYDKPSVLIGRKGTIDKPVYMDTPFWTVDTLFYTEVFTNTFPKWLFYKFQTINWYLYNEASGVPSLSGSTIYKIKFDLPCIEEQTKIANFLSTLDDKINHCSVQIEKTEQWKKGLLQKMFC